MIGLKENKEYFKMLLNLKKKDHKIVLQDIFQNVIKCKKKTIKNIHFKRVFIFMQRLPLENVTIITMTLCVTPDRKNLLTYVC